MYDDILILSDLLNTVEEIQAGGGVDPTGVFGDLIAQIRALVQSIIDSANSKISGWITSAKNSVKTYIGLAKDAIKDKIDETKELITDKITGAKDAIEGFVQDTKAVIRDKIENTKTFLNNTISSAKETITTHVTGAVDKAKYAINGAIDTVKTNISNLSSDVYGWVKNAKDTILENIDGTLGGLGDAFKEAIGWVKDGIANLVSEVKETAQSIGTSIANALSDVGDFLAEIISGIVEGATTWLGNVIQGVKESIVSVIDTVKQTVQNTISTAKSWIYDVYSNIQAQFAIWKDQLKEAYEGLKETIQEKIQKIVDWLIEVKNMLVDAFWDILQNVVGWIGENVMPKFNDAVEGATALVGLGKLIWEHVSSGDYDGAFSIIDDFANGLGIPAPVQTIWSIVSAMAYFWQTVSIQFVPMQIAAAKQANINLALDPVSIDASAQAVFRGDASLDDFYANARLGGVTKDRANIVLNTNRPLVSPGEVQQLFMRGDITEKEHDARLSQFGFSNEDITLFKGLYFLIPGPNDLISMAVREAFSPDIAQQFGQFEDFPPVFAEWAAKQGLSEDWALKYWAAHWDLPSPQMGFEMLHRGIVTDDELTLLLRALDVMPFWREKIIQMSYAPLTRVDVRRMYQVGVLSEEQVTRAYLDLGYNEEKAGWLTEFTKRYSAPEDETELDQFKALARSSYSLAFRRNIISRDEYKEFLLNMGYYVEDVNLLISIDEFNKEQDEKLFDLNDYRKDWQKLLLKAYDTGLISEEEVTTALSELGYTESEVALELSLVSYNRQLVLRNILLKQVSKQYITYIIDETSGYEILNSFGFTANEIAKLFEEWNIERSFRTDRPTMTDLKKFFQSNLLSLDELLDEIRGTGMNERYMPLFAAMFGTGAS